MNFWLKVLTGISDLELVFGLHSSPHVMSELVLIYEDSMDSIPTDKTLEKILCSLLFWSLVSPQDLHRYFHRVTVLITISLTISCIVWDTDRRESPSTCNKFDVILVLSRFFLYLSSWCHLTRIKYDYSFFVSHLTSTAFRWSSCHREIYVSFFFFPLERFTRVR